MTKPPSRGAAMGGWVREGPSLAKRGSSERMTASAANRKRSRYKYMYIIGAK